MMSSFPLASSGGKYVAIVKELHHICVATF